MRVKSTAECYTGAFSDTFDPHKASICLENLFVLSSLSGHLTGFTEQPYLFITENPLAEEDDYRMETLIALRKLERLDKDEYNEEERAEAEELAEARKQEELNAEVIPALQEVSYLLINEA